MFLTYCNDCVCKYLEDRCRNHCSLFPAKRYLLSSTKVFALVIKRTFYIQKLKAPTVTFGVLF